MRRAPILAAGAWTLATVAATLVSWVGVGTVTRAVSAAPAPVIPEARITSDQRPLSAVGQSAAPSVTPPVTVPTTTTTTSPPVPVPVTPTLPDHNASATTPTTAPASDLPSVAAPPTIPTPPTPALRSATYTSLGGAVTVQCSGDTISLLSALPANGYQLNVINDGPRFVAVSFSGGGAPSEIGALCQAGNPVRASGDTGRSGWPGTPRRPESNNNSGGSFNGGAT